MTGAANSLYAIARQRFGSGLIKWESGAFRMRLVNQYYTPDFERDVSVADLGDTVVAVSPRLTGLSIVDGFAVAAGVGFPALSSNYDVRTIVVAEEATGFLVWGTQEGYGLPFSPRGEDWYVLPDQAFPGLFRL